MPKKIIRRVRDKMVGLRPQQVIPYDEWVDIEDKFAQASGFLKEGHLPYEILKAELKEAEEIVLTNRVHEVKEVRLFGDIQKIFTTNKKEQMDELVGQIKFIRGYMGELQSWIDRKVELERLEGEGRIAIRRNPPIDSEEGENE
jgi:hypothetical protein